METNKKYWLRGGITVLALYAILFLAYFLYIYPHLSEINFMFAPLILVFSAFPTSFLAEGLDLLPHSSSVLTVMFVTLIAGMIQWFVAGSVIGWAYGKIKNKSTNNSN